MSLACAITPTKCVSHTHRTHPTNKRQAAAGSLARSALAACRHEPLAESARRSPWLPPTAPVPLPRFACFVSGSIEAYDMPPSRGVGRFVRPCIGPAGMAAPTPSGPPHRLTFGAGSIERTARSMSRMGSMGEPTRHVCRHGVANGVKPRPVGSPFVRCPLRKAPARCDLCGCRLP